MSFSQLHIANAGLSGYSTDQSERNVVSGLSPLPFVSPSLGLGPQMHPRLPQSTSLASSPGYPTHLYSSPAGHTALLLQQQQQHRNALPTGALKYSSSTAMPWLGSPVRAEGDAFKPEAVQDSQAGSFKAQHAQRGAENDAPGAVRDSQARSPEAQHAQHAQHSAGGPTGLEKQTGFPRRIPASGNHTGGDLQADEGPVRDADTNAMADPVPALQTNLTAMDAAISRTAAAAVPLQPLHPVTAASSSQPQQTADPTPKPAVAAFLPVQAAVAPPQSGKSQANDLKPASFMPISSLPLQAQRVSLPASSSLPSMHHGQPVSMAPTGMAPQQVASLPPGNSAPIGPPAMRAMTCHGQGAWPQLAAPTLLPLLPTGEKSASCSTAATHLASAAAGVIPMTAAAQGEPTGRSAAVLDGPAGVQSDLRVKSEALPEASKSEVSRDDKGGSTQQGLQLHPGNVSSQQAGPSVRQQVTVSAASTVMLDEARAAGTARQAALAVLNDTAQPVPASHSLPDQPFGSAQSSLATAVGTSRQLAPIADLPPSTAVGASRQLFSDAGMPSVTAVGLAPSAKPQAIATMASMGQAQSLMAMTGPLPATGQGQEADSPVGGRPSQSETAVIVGRGGGIVTAPQDLHAAHLVHVLQAHKVSQQLSDSQAQEEEPGVRQQAEGPLSGGSSLPRIPEHSAAEAPATGECWQNRNARRRQAVI